MSGMMTGSISGAISKMTSSLHATLAAAVKSAIGEWQAGGKMKRLWQHDASLWTGSDEASWLGWLDIVDEQIAQHDQLAAIAKDVHSTGFDHVLLLGMGGSSLCPEVLRMTFGKTPGFPELHVLDSTDPAQVKAFEHLIDFSKTLFIVSSKSGSTLEPNSSEPRKPAATSSLSPIPAPRCSR
jgi:transaldolase/glucose-6-phosphate isomerase